MVAFGYQVFGWIMALVGIGLAFLILVWVVMQGIPGFLGWLFNRDLGPVAGTARFVALIVLTAALFELARLVFARP